LLEGKIAVLPIEVPVSRILEVLSLKVLDSRILELEGIVSVLLVLEIITSVLFTEYLDSIVVLLYCSLEGIVLELVSETRLESILILLESVRLVEVSITILEEASILFILESFSILEVRSEFGPQLQVGNLICAREKSCSS